MLGRFLTGDYNATTSIVIALFINVAAGFVLHFMGLFIFMPSLLAFFGVVWGLIAAGNNPENGGFGRFMCWVFALLQLGAIALPVWAIINAFGVIHNVH